MSDKCLEGMPPLQRKHPDTLPRTAEELLKLAQDAAARKNSPEYMKFLKENVR